MMALVASTVSAAVGANRNSPAPCPWEEGLYQLRFMTKLGPKRLAVPKTSVLEMQGVDRQDDRLIVAGKSRILLNFNTTATDGSTRVLVGMRLTLLAEQMFDPVKRLTGPVRGGRTHDLWRMYTEKRLRERIGEQTRGWYFLLDKYISSQEREALRPRCERCKMALKTLYYVRSEWSAMSRVLMTCIYGRQCGLLAYVKDSVQVGVIVWPVDPVTGGYRFEHIPKRFYLDLAHKLDRFLAETVACAK